jgi:hypothetical protein
LYYYILLSNTIIFWGVPCSRSVPFLPKAVGSLRFLAPGKNARQSWKIIIPHIKLQVIHFSKSKEISLLPGFEQLYGVVRIERFLSVVVLKETFPSCQIMLNPNCWQNPHSFISSLDPVVSSYAMKHTCHSSPSLKVDAKNTPAMWRPEAEVETLGLRQLRSHQHLGRARH